MLLSVKCNVVCGLIIIWVIDNIRLSSSMLRLTAIDTEILTLCGTSAKLQLATQVIFNSMMLLNTSMATHVKLALNSFSQQNFLRDFENR